MWRRMCRDANLFFLYFTFLNNVKMTVEISCHLYTSYFTHITCKFLNQMINQLKVTLSLKSYCVNFTETQNVKKEQRKPEATGVLHHYVQLFYLWFPQNIISILLHTMHVIKVQWINFKEKKSKTRKEKIKEQHKKQAVIFNHEERHWLRYYMYNTIYSRIGLLMVPSTAMPWQLFMLKRQVSARSTEVWWVLLQCGVRVWG